MKKISLGKLLVSILICNGAGLVGSMATRSSVQGWYATLVRPSFAPPNWIFGPVWTVLYCLMGIALYCVWSRAQERPVKVPLVLFSIQLILNASWSFLFFGLESTRAGFVGIMLLLVAIIATMVSFVRISKAAVWLLVPYILWVSFAAALNFQFMCLNG